MTRRAGVDAGTGEIMVELEENEDGNKVAPELREVLLRWADVFTAPQGLPPTRARDHPIVLKEGTSPINV